jgi:hypothetical protein
LIKDFRRECNCEITTMAIPIIKQGSWHWSYGRDHTWYRIWTLKFWFEFHPMCKWHLKLCVHMMDGNVP